MNANQFHALDNIRVLKSKDVVIAEPHYVYLWTNSTDISNGFRVDPHGFPALMGKGPMLCILLNYLVVIS